MRLPFVAVLCLDYIPLAAGPACLLLFTHSPSPLATYHTTPSLFCTTAAFPVDSFQFCHYAIYTIPPPCPLGSVKKTGSFVPGDTYVLFLLVDLVRFVRWWDYSSGLRSTYRSLPPRPYRWLVGLRSHPSGLFVEKHCTLLGLPAAVTRILARTAFPSYVYSGYRLFAHAFLHYNIPAVHRFIRILLTYTYFFYYSFSFYHSLTRDAGPACTVYLFCHGITDHVRGWFYLPGSSVLRWRRSRRLRARLPCLHTTTFRSPFPRSYWFPAC